MFAQVRKQAPHVYSRENYYPKNFFSACIGFVPGGVLWNTVGATMNDVCWASVPVAMPRASIDPCQADATG